MKLGVVSGDWIHPSRTENNKESFGGSGWARIAQYLPHMEFTAVTGTLVWNRDHFAVKTSDDTMHYVSVVFMHRLMHAGLAEHMRLARQSGQIIINDIDDWFWGLDTSNKAFQTTHPKLNRVENVQHYRSILAASDLVVASTPYLASRLSWVRCPVEIATNTVDLSKFSTKQHSEGVPTVGWVGSTDHRSGDLETVAPVLRQLYRDGECRLFHGGAHPRHESFASRIGLEDEDVTTMSLCPADDYPKLMVMDIGVVPLRVTPFNRAKSDIKGLEYAAAGVPFIAQSIDSYNNLRESLGVGRLAKKPADWIKHFRALSDPVLRAEEAEKNKEAVRARDISVGAKHLQDLIHSVTPA
jgi:hypothetical protein